MKFVVFGYAALPIDEYFDDCRSVIAVCIGNSEWSAKIRSAFIDTKRFSGWAPKESELESTPEQSFGYFLSLGVGEMWRSQWCNGTSELRIFGRGESPSPMQKRIWAFILPKLDKILDLAITSLPPPPKRTGLLRFLKPKEISLDLRFIMLDLYEDGSYELRFETDLVLDEGKVGGIVTMKDDHVIEAEWSV